MIWDPALAAEHDTAEWAAAWLRHLDAPGGADFWSWASLEYAATLAPERAWPVVLELVASAPRHRLRDVGAGPLESLLESHPERFAERLAGAGTDARFREAMSAVRRPRRAVASRPTARGLRSRPAAGRGNRA